MKNIDNTYHIGCSTDDNYVHHASVMICSLLENNRDNAIVVHLLHDVLSQENVDFLTSLVHRYGAGIVFHKVDVRRLAGVKFRTHRPLSMAAYYRLLLSSVLDGLDKVLYLDVDTAVLGNVSHCSTSRWMAMLLRQSRMWSHALMITGHPFRFHMIQIISVRL